MIQIIKGRTPSKSNTYRIIKIGNRASLAKTPETRAYERNFILQCNKYRNKRIEGDFKLDIDVYFPSNRQDLDNSLKVVLDCLQECKAIVNDRACIEINARKFIDKNNPRIEFKIVEI